jgi:hypothetical protein
MLGGSWFLLEDLRVEGWSIPLSIRLMIWEQPHLPAGRLQLYSARIRASQTDQFFHCRHPSGLTYVLTVASSPFKSAKKSTA